MMQQSPDRRATGQAGWIGTSERRAEVRSAGTLSREELFAILEEPGFQDLVSLAAEVCRTPISLLTLLDDSRQWIRASVGTELTDTPRNVAFCSHAVQSPDLFVVEDATRDERFRENPLVTGSCKIRFYAGIPLRQGDNQPFGTLCVIDDRPRTIDERQAKALAILGRQVQAALELRLRKRRLETALAEVENLSTKLRESNELFATFMEHAPMLSYIKDAEGRYVFYNQATADQFGVTTEAWIGKRDADLWDPVLAEAYRGNDLQVLASGMVEEFKEVSRNGSDPEKHWHSYKFPVKNRRGDLLLAGMSFDRTKEVESRHAVERALAEKIELARSLEQSRAQFKAFMEANPNMASLKRADGTYLYYNRKFADFFGVSTTEWLGRKDFDVLPKDLVDLARKHDADAVNEDGVVELAAHLRDVHGRGFEFKTLRFTYRDVNGDAVVGGVYLDVTHEVQRQRQLGELNAQLEVLAGTDALTGLANRRIFEAHARDAFEAASVQDKPLSVLVLDLDNFKRRNDELGHAAGDEALRQVGRVLQETIACKGTVARVGGEEFSVLLPGFPEEQAYGVAQEILALVRMAVAGLTVSIGVAERTRTAANWQRLMARADDAMYEAKRTGKDRAVMHGAIVSRLLGGMQVAAFETTLA